MKKRSVLHFVRRLTCCSYLKQMTELRLWAPFCVAFAAAFLCGPSVRAQTCSVDPGCFVQYKVTGANLSKCGFPEFVAATPPRARRYHHQKTVADYENQFDTYDTNGYDIYDDWGGGSWALWAYADGVAEEHFLDTKNVTEDEWGNGMYCVYTNIFSGSSTHYDEKEDTRSRGFSGYVSSVCVILTKYTYSLDVNDADIAYVPNGRDRGWDSNWGWVGQENVNTDTIQTPGCGGGVNYVEIDAAHVGGWPWTDSSNAELQKMKYQFGVPDSQWGVEYKITWDVITYDLSTGSSSKSSLSTTVQGTGDPSNPALSDDFD